MTISIIIPTYNEELVLTENKSYFKDLSKYGEVIFVDGKSGDNTVNLAEDLGKVIMSPKCRAIQMNMGARAAKGEALLFLHADTMIEGKTIAKIAYTLNKKKIIGGCLTHVYKPGSPIFRFIAFTGNLRARLTKIFYGDQGIFVRKDVFEKIGGFPDVKICEDILFSKKLRENGKTRVLPYYIYCSPRRWAKGGIIKTFLTNMRISFRIIFNRDINGVVDIYKDIR